ncbi:MAG: hypothetical protein CW336_04065 [Bacteroidetes bacterium]|nr:hypothetical protein [Bacteroidota bacterium]
MKCFIYKIILFFILVSLLDICVGLLGDYLQSHAKGGSTRDINDLVINDCHDILIFGSSRASHHYDSPFLSDTLALDVYNAGFDGNGVVLAYPILLNILERCEPQMVIYDITNSFDIVRNSADDNNIRYLSNLKPYYKIPVVKEVIQSISSKDYLKMYSAMYRYNSNIPTMFVDNLKYRSNRNKGYSPLYGNYDNFEIHSTVTKQEYAIDSLKIYWLERLASLKNDKNLRMVWVISPYFTPSVVDDKSLSIVNELASNYNIPLWNYYNDTSFVRKSELFVDASHLNNVGSREFSRIVASEITNSLNKTLNK